MNEKKMCYIEHKNNMLFDVLEQFNIELFNIDVMESILFLFFVIFFGALFFYDLWLCFAFFFFFSVILLFNTSTTNFILLIFWFLGVLIILEAISPVIDVGYFFFAVITDFILTKTKEHLGGKLQAYYIFLIGTAFILGFFNVIGLLPFTTALTGQFIFAFYFSIMYFVVNLICGVLFHKNKIFNLFLPKGVPLFIVPALILIEAIPFFSRVLSLAIRLFANIVAGHILLKILVSFLNVILKAHISFGFPSVIAFLGIFVIIVLEVFISILQVYIFNLLLLIYINGVLELH